MICQSVDTEKHHTVHLPQPSWAREELAKWTKVSEPQQQLGAEAQTQWEEPVYFNMPTGPDYAEQKQWSRPERPRTPTVVCWLLLPTQGRPVGSLQWSTRMRSRASGLPTASPGPLFFHWLPRLQTEAQTPGLTLGLGSLVTFPAPLGLSPNICQPRAPHPPVSHALWLLSPTSRVTHCSAGCPHHSPLTECEALVSVTSWFWDCITQYSGQFKFCFSILSTKEQK